MKTNTNYKQFRLTSFVANLYVRLNELTTHMVTCLIKGQTYSQGFANPTEVRIVPNVYTERYCCFFKWRKCELMLYGFVLQAIVSTVTAAVFLRSYYKYRYCPEYYYLYAMLGVSELMCNISSFISNCPLSRQFKILILSR